MLNVVKTTEQFGAFVIDTTERWGRAWLFLLRIV